MLDNYRTPSEAPVALPGSGLAPAPRSRQEVADAYFAAAFSFAMVAASTVLAPSGVMTMA